MIADTLAKVTKSKMRNMRGIANPNRLAITNINATRIVTFRVCGGSFLQK